MENHTRGNFEDGRSASFNGKIEIALAPPARSTPTKKWHSADGALQYDYFHRALWTMLV
jgi:hypothetical protein